MKTVLVDKENIDIIVEFLRNNQVIAFPTETVFGLGVRFSSKEALQSIYDLKQRESSKAVTLMVANPKDIEKYAIVDSTSKKIIETFMPGEITIILKKQISIDEYFTAGKETIGIRIPNDPFVLELLKQVGPMLVTSANMSGYPDMINDQEVQNVFGNKIPMIVRGQSKSGIPSTVVDCSREVVKVVRKGNISLKQMEEVIQ